MKFRFVYLKIAALLLCLVTVCASLSACANSEQVNAKKVVGTVDGMEICYDELYMLANRYRATAEKAAKEKGSSISDELEKLIEENITLHTAMIRQGESLGLSYNPKEWKDSIDREITSIINNSFEGDKNAYRESMKQNSLTERYVEYTIGVDLFYEQLLVEYPKRGLVLSGEADVRTYVEENFIHVYHLALFFDESNQAEQFARITEAREKLMAGESMYSLIKKGYTEDFLDPSAKGYYITKGSMDEAYEKAAFDLHLGQISEVVEAKGYNNDNQYSSCYYVIQRFDLDEDYVNEHLNDLQTEYYNSVIYADLQKKQAALSFEENDFYRELNLTDLPAPRDGMPTWALFAIIGGIVVVFGGALTLSIVLICKKPKKTKQAALGKGTK